jgi:hypothetical protein
MASQAVHLMNPRVVAATETQAPDTASGLPGLHALEQ